MSTLCDPRCFLNQVALQDLSFRFKDSFFLSDATGERARQVFHTLVEAEYENLGANTNEAQEEQDESGDEASSSILHNLRKRICRDRERQIEVEIYAPLEEFKCLRCFENVRIHLSNVNTGFGISTSKPPTLMTRSPRLS